MPIQIVVITAAFLLLTIAPFSESVYSLLRIMTFGTFAWGAYSNFTKQPLYLPLLYTLFAVFFNPLFELHSPEAVRISAHIAAAAILLLTRKHFTR